MTAQRERAANGQRDDQEILELKAMDQDSRQRALSAEVQRVKQTQSENLERKQSMAMRAEKQEIEHQIAMQKIDNDMRKSLDMSDMIHLAVATMSGDDMDELLETTNEQKDSENEATPEPTQMNLSKPAPPVRSKSRLGMSKQMVIPL